MTTKQRAYLKGLAMTMDPIFHNSSLLRFIFHNCEGTEQL